MKIVCIEMILCLCLALDSGNPKQEDNRELIQKFLQFLAAPNGKGMISFLITSSTVSTILFQCG